MSKEASNYSDTPEDFHQLLEQLCESSLDETRQVQLVDSLRNSQKLRLFYVRSMSLHFWLRLRFNRYKDNLQESELAELFTQEVEKPAAAASPNKWFYGFAAAALVLLALLPALLWVLGKAVQPNFPSSSAAYAALVSSTYDCQWAADSHVNRLGQVIREGDRLSLESGIVQLQFDSGATTIIKGPAELKVIDAHACFLESGEVVAQVRGQPGGFVVHTEFAKIVDTGTEFGVVHLSKQKLHLQVFEGEVQIFGKSAQQSTTSQDLLRNLTAGEKASLVFADGAATVAEADSNYPQFVRAMPASALHMDTSELMAIDGFGTDAGGSPLAGRQSGYGWNSPWQNQSVDLTTTEIITFAGEATNRDQGSAAVHRRLPQVLGGSDKIFASANFRIVGDDPVCTAWILLFQEEPSPGHDEANLMAFGISDRKFSARLSPRESELTLSPNSKRLGDFGHYQPGESHLLVARLEMNAVGNKERLSLWIDPPGESLSPPETPDQVVHYDTGRNTIDTLALRFWEMDGQTRGYIDNLRLGTSWEAVVR